LYLYERERNGNTVRDCEMMSNILMTNDETDKQQSEMTAAIEAKMLGEFERESLKREFNFFCCCC
jgi:hypothetical protein